MTNSTEVTAVNAAMLDRGSSFERTPSVMDNIHKIKIYNANYFSKDPKENTVNEELVGKFRVASEANQKLTYIDSWFKADILTVCKVKSGNVFVLDEFGDAVKDSNWNSKKAFFYTNEHSVFTKKTDMLWFKQAWQKPLWFYIKQDLEEILRSKKINWKDNPFWKQWRKLDGEPYNDTNISDTIIIYWIFIDWPFAWEYFKFVPVSWSRYGTTYKWWQTVEPEQWTFLHAINVWLKEWNKVRTANGKAEVKSVDPSQIDMKISFREVEVQNKRMFVPTFEFAWLTAYRTDNTNDLQSILEIQSEYLKEEFWLSIIPNNFRLGSIQDVDVSNANTIEVKAIEASKDSNTDEDETVIEIIDAEEIFDEKAVKVANAAAAAKVPF